jgi:alpha-L-rhamnosidase
MSAQGHHVKVVQPTNLRVEHLDSALGLVVRRPRLSWWLPQGSSVQHAYRIETGEWDSGLVQADQSVLVPYGGPTLRTTERVEWRVKVWTDAGESEWSEPGWWEMGLLKPSDWMARWVEPGHNIDAAPFGPCPGFLLSHEFSLNGPIVTARVYATAHGIYELFLNGCRVGDAELTPGFTTYRKNLLVQTFDVTDLLNDGANTVSAVVSEGWFRQQLGAASTHTFGDGFALLVQLHALSPNGTLARIGTGPDWVWSTSDILSAGLVAGQISDLREGRSGAATGRERRWFPVQVRDYDLGRLCSSPAPPVRRVQTLQPASITRLSTDRQVVDLGQNINGWVRLDNLGPTGTTLNLTYGEALNADGDVTLDNILKPPDDLVAAGLIAAGLSPVGEESAHNSAFQVDQVTAAGIDGESFEPRHTTHGFRYVRIEGHPGALTPTDVTGVVVHTDLRRTGWFECSDERINRLHEVAVWTFRDNACDIPTDCPQRERLGWTGDWQIFVPAAAFLYDVAGFSTKWLRDVAAEQLPNGAVQWVAPMHVPEEPPLPFVGPDFVPTSAGWGDAAVIVPWEIYRAYGDEQLLVEQWPSMVAWVEYAARAARERRHPSRALARPTPSPHEEFLWDGGFHWGEWIEPPDDPYVCFRPDFAARDQAVVATAYLHRSARLLGQIARILGRETEAARHEQLADGARLAWQTEFINADGSLTVDTQAAHTRALAFELVPDELRAQTAQRLVELIRQADTHVATGFLSTGLLLPALAETGHLDVAYELLLRDTPPSWLTMIERGATTIWERWDGVDEHNVAQPGSLNHYSRGAVISFLHNYLSGIRLLNDAPAYRRFRIEPMLGGGVTWARAVHDSPYGRIESSWRVARRQFTLDVVVPPGASADVRLPNGDCVHAESGRASYSCSVPSAVSA